MVLIAERVMQPLIDDALRSMFAARKRVFVDLLKWDLPVIEGRFELDRFDDEYAVYLVIHDAAGAHLGSARLLQTIRPHLLDTLFADLCEAAPPRGPDVLEITRFCLDRRLSAQRRLAVRNRLVSALADYALERGVSAYTGIAEIGWLQQILAFGWRCRPLGRPRTHGGKMLGALRIDVSAETPVLLARAGIYMNRGAGPASARRAA